jgi:hypothetical protein
MTKHLCISSTKYIYIYTKCITVSVPSSELGPPYTSSEYVPAPEPKGGHTRLRLRGWGGLYTLSAL